MIHGSEYQHKRYAQKTEPKSRRHCNCGCKKRATHRGMANGVCLMSGCEFTVRLWVKGGSEAIIRRRNIK